MAKRFRFRLETVLKVRRQREDQQKRVVAAKVRRLTDLQSQARSVDEQIAQAVQAARGSRHPGALDMSQIARQRFWLGHLQRLLVETAGQIREVAEELHRERRVLIDLAKDRKALEKLKETQAQRYQAELDRAERIELDELATTRACRMEPR
jgi:flagellar FliJ protein